jgi:hypothetical protein
MNVTGTDMITREDIAHIVANLRERDRVEIFGLRWDDNPDTLVRDICAVAGPMWRVWKYDGEPVAMNGVIPQRPGVCTCGAFGTEKWRHIVRAMTRWSRDWVIPRLQAAHYHRGEAIALASNTDGRRFIELLGGQIEAFLYHYGRQREDYILYAWRLDDDVFSRKRRCNTGLSNISLNQTRGAGYGRVA